MIFFVLYCSYELMCFSICFILCVCLQLSALVVTEPKKRRSTIPPKPNARLNLWNLMKNCIGRELSKIPLPVSQQKIHLPSCFQECRQEFLFRLISMNHWHSAKLSLKTCNTVTFWRRQLSVKTPWSRWHMWLHLPFLLMPRLSPGLANLSIHCWEKHMNVMIQATRDGEHYQNK